MPPVELLCPNCHKKFLKPVYQYRFRLKNNPKTKFYCSKICANEALKTNNYSICTHCGKEFYVSKSQLKLRGIKRCSDECRRAAQGISKVKRISKKGAPKQALQNIVNKYCRLRDCFGEQGAACISCGKWEPFERGDGGHFISAKYSATRFDERNVNFQCIRCNRFLHGNLANYYVGMVKKYGQEVVDELMQLQHTSRKWKEDEIKQLRKYFSEKIKDIERGVAPHGTRHEQTISDLFG